MGYFCILQDSYTHTHTHNCLFLPAQTYQSINIWTNMNFMVYFLTFSPSSPHDFIKCGPTLYLLMNPFLLFWKVWMILWWYKHDCDLWWCFIRSSLHFPSGSAGFWVFFSLVFLCLWICLHNICPVHEFVNGHVTFKRQWASNIKCHISRLDTQFVRYGASYWACLFKECVCQHPVLTGIKGVTSRP